MSDTDTKLWHRWIKNASAYISYQTWLEVKVHKLERQIAELQKQRDNLVSHKKHRPLQNVVQK